MGGAQAFKDSTEFLSTSEINEDENYKCRSQQEADESSSAGTYFEREKPNCFECSYESSTASSALKEFVEAVNRNLRASRYGHCDYDEADYESSLAGRLKPVSLTTTLGSEKTTLNIFYDSLDKKYLCDQCDYKTSLRSDCSRHIKCVHLKLKKFFCDFCNYKASHKAHLDKHTKSIHLKIRDFNCNFCQYKASRKFVLDCHIKNVHSDIKKFACSLCDFKTIQQSFLNRHIRGVHLEMRTFPCGECNHYSKTRGDLNRHIESAHSKDRKFECEMCEYKTTRKSSLKKHVERIH